MADECVSGGCTKDGRPCPECGGEVPKSLGTKPRKYCSTQCCSRASSRKRSARRAAKPVVCRRCGAATEYAGTGRRAVLCSVCRESPVECHCKRCGVTFYRAHPADYCSGECRKKPRKIIECGTCGKAFAAKSSGSKYCSVPCKQVANKERLRVANKARAARYKCLNCGVSYTARNRSRCSFKYCSRDCAFEARRLKKQCAKRPIYAYRAMASWFLSWGDDQWPRVAKCGCGDAFVAQRSESADCRDSCQKCLRRAQRVCPGCGVELAQGTRLCSTCRSARNKEYRRKNKRSRRAKHGNACTFRQRCKRYGCRYTSVSKKAVMERDGWRCRLCGDKLLGEFTTLPGTRTPHPKSPTIDHIVPLSFGPSSPGHVFGNCQAACWACNCERGVEDANSFAARKATALH